LTLFTEYRFSETDFDPVLGDSGVRRQLVVPYPSAIKTGTDYKRGTTISKSVVSAPYFFVEVRLFLFSADEGSG
jgi:hypothetical protein